MIVLCIILQHDEGQIKLHVSYPDGTALDAAEDFGAADAQRDSAKTGAGVEKVPEAEGVDEGGRDDAPLCARVDHHFDHAVVDLAGDVEEGVVDGVVVLVKWGGVVM
eukprot:CAMPEP_0202465226 /NCGR_PEP_ID=MMETSP1360-20130828/64848_1 /ASSEMBLY_ACC=CAM_ASM_000848 /TAXON_ID=515479 /ORGANISM="Licmophora paradoxa, Strain CCMP2313" /LENGTH=106 /DNA_ID=CAMNT_0049088879 /DNA_START=128 /DNA_END=445 /DNA_ORIENTATION=+